MSSIDTHEFFGEMIGTFILVFFGCGAIAVSVLFSPHISLLHVAVMWGAAVTLAIYASRNFSCAHINPALSLAMAVGSRIRIKKMLVYWAGQFIGAFLAAAALYYLFSSHISQFEAVNAIVRGSSDSVKTAMIFGEFYPNPSLGGTLTVTTTTALAAETAGTFLLVFMVFALTEGKNVGENGDLSPLFIGMTVMVIIGLIAPVTQAGINPARDLSPRIFAYLAGWKYAAFPAKPYGALTVYVLGPFAGGALAALTFTKLIKPMYKMR